MSGYVDGFVIPVRRDRLEAYRAIAEKACAIWKELGALEYWECVGDDLDVKDLTSFPQLAQTGPEETVVFSWIRYRSREHRDEVNAKIMADPRIREMCEASQQVFDCRRMAYGGFRPLVVA